MTHWVIAHLRKPVIKPETLLLHCCLDGGAYDPNMLSEIRAPGGLLAASGIMILAGAFQMHARRSALQLTALVYGSFGLARLVSVALDGVPSASIFAAMSLEIIVAVVALVVLRRTRAQRPASHALAAAPAAR